MGDETCGGRGAPCCDGNYCEDLDQFCDNGMCAPVTPGAGACADKGALGQPCCFQACAGGASIVCSAGTCVDKAAEQVLDQSGGPLPGQEGGPCIGADAMCDENDEVILECVDLVCKREEGAGVLDQSVRPQCHPLPLACFLRAPGA